MLFTVVHSIDKTFLQLEKLNFCNIKKKEYSEY